MIENNESHVPMRPAEIQNLDIVLKLGRASVIYADEYFTVYITVKNISSRPLYVWTFGILASTEFEFKRSESLEQALQPKEKIIKKLTGFFPKIPGKLESSVFYILSFKSRIKKAYSDYRLEEQLEGSLPTRDEFSVQKGAEEKELPDDEIDKKLTEDYLRIYYRNEIKTGRSEPWEISPGESVTDIFIGNTRESLFFRPDKYKLTLYVDYSNSDQAFFRETKVEEVDILAPISSIIYGAIFGGVLGGTLVRILVAHDISDILNWISLFEIFGTGILSVFAVIALARKTGAQTLVTIQDFWGGVLIGFLVGYSGKTLFDKILGM